jgi:alpha-glucosidase
MRDRYALLPYLESLWDEHARSGAPPLRAMAFEYFEDRALRRVDDQAMLGPWLLIAPLLEEGAAEREVRLPEGRWYELESGAIWDGPAAIRVNATLAALPMFVREGAILPRTNGHIAHTGELRHDVLRIDLYPAAHETSFTLYEDAGDGHGPHARTPLSLVRTDSGARLTFGAREGAFDPSERFIELRLWRADGEVRGVRRIGSTMSMEALARRSSPDALESGGEGYFHDENERTLIVRVRDPGASGATIEFDYVGEIVELRPTIAIDIEVEVPEGTPTESTIHIASDANGWTHQPLTWITPRRARGTLHVPRGAWFFYKFTRGSWETVEKWPGCLEAENRYGFGRAGLREDRVWEWRDICE